MDNQQPVNPVQQPVLPQPPVPSQPLEVQPPVVVQSPVVVAPIAPSLPAAPASPISGPHKEFAPQVRTVEAPVAEYIKPAEVTPIIPQEVAESGVETSADIEHPRLDDTHAQVGLQHAPPAMPVMPSAPVSALPYTYEQADKIENATQIDDSQHWLVALTKFIIRKVQVKT